MSENQPLVSILTPVYNGEKYLVECIESVLAQDYRNWEYHIVNNRSTDGTLRIAEEFAAKDERIRVTTNRDFVSMPENFNNAFSKVHPASRYFKVVCADDWILPQCVSTMVSFAEQHPSVGILCCHQQSGKTVRWAELPVTTSVLRGREACRLALLEGVQLFGAPTAFLYRSSLLRLGKSFFPNLQPHSDTSACYEFLEHCDYGVVHELLAVERLHDEQISSQIESNFAGDLAYLEVLLEYGPRYLTDAELQARADQVFDQYYRGLGGALLKLKGDEFWEYQKSRLMAMGHRLDRRRIFFEAIAEAGREARNPLAALRKVRAVVKDRARRRAGAQSCRR
jgi:glycosyltransferase involved in cell wall biosynthesis